jgi:hypothetical protein
MRNRFSSIAAVVRLGGAVALVLAGTLALSAGPATASPYRSAPRAYTCTGGEVNFADPPLSTYAPAIPSGTYASLTIAGVCQPAPDAVIRVLGNINVAAGAVLDAQGVPSTISVRGNVTAADGSLLALGCLPDPVGHTTGHPCGTSLAGQTLSNIDPTSASDITVHGNVIATDANTVWLNGITVGGNVALIGGGQQTGTPWPIKTNTIYGNLIVFGATPEWLGVVVNNIGGNVFLGNVTIAPGETIDVANNSIGWNLVCWNLAPAVSAGFIGEVNTVGGWAIGQCPLAGDVNPESS